jgi:integrase
MMPPEFVALIDEYLAMRRGLGFELKTPSWLLYDFARYADRIGHRGPMTVDLAVQWAQSSTSTDPAQAVRRLEVVRQFARHRAVIDPANEVPPAGLLGRRPRRKSPHIYSEEEISALLRQASLLLPRCGLRPRTYVTFFSLLISTGLRLSEACHLSLGDVDLCQGVITVREGKFRKSRLIPLHPSTTQALTDYAGLRTVGRDARPSEHFFCTDHAAAIRYASVEKTFSRLRQKLGWTDDGRTRRPRIHDLRHTFAVRRLLRWYKEGVDVDRKILALSTYLGHAKATDTYWYISSVPELMAVTSARFERFVTTEQEGAS